MMSTLFRKALSRKRRGYSLLEILIVLTIIALIATLVGPRLISALDRSKSTTVAVQSRAIAAALNTMYLDLGRYPSAEEGLTILVNAPSEGGETWRGPYLESGLPDDPWGRPYEYFPPATIDASPRVGSLGADGRTGGSGSAADVFSDSPRS